MVAWGFGWVAVQQWRCGAVMHWAGEGQEALCFPPYGFIAVQDKQDAALMLGCSIVEIEWVVFYETVRFLGQLSHSLKGSGF